MEDLSEGWKTFMGGAGSGLANVWGCRGADTWVLPLQPLLPLASPEAEEKPELLQDGGFLLLPKVPVPF